MVFPARGCKGTGLEEKQPHPAGPALGSEERPWAARSRPRREKVCTALGSRRKAATPGWGSTGERAEMAGGQEQTPA